MSMTVAIDTSMKPLAEVDLRKAASSTASLRQERAV